jgi:hypothetical protein
VSVVFRTWSLPSLLPLLPLLLLPLLLAGSVTERAAVTEATTCAIGAAPVGAPLALRLLGFPEALAPHVGTGLAPDAGIRRPGHGSEPGLRRASVHATTRPTPEAVTYLAYAVESHRSRLNYPTTFGNPPPHSTS